MKVLQVYYKMPFPMYDGGACSVYAASSSLLSRKIDLRILAMNPLKAPGEIRLIPADFVSKTRFESVVVDNRIDPFRAFIRLFGHTSYLAGRFRSDSFLEKLMEILRQEDFDIIQLEHLYLCCYLSDIRKISKAKVVLRAQNVENKVWLDYLRRSKNPLIRGYLRLEARRLEKFEGEMAQQVDGIMAISQADADYFRKTAGGKETAAIAFGMDLTSLNTAGTDKKFRNFPVVYHLGSMDWRPNIQGLKWFVRKVLPLVVREMPDICIHLAGRNMPGWFFNRSNRNLIVEGVVDDAARYREDKSIMIVPLLSGSGIRIKILEGMALGETVVSTTVGAAGIHAVNNKDILIADTPEAFAGCICRAARSPSLCREIGSMAQKTILNNYDIRNIGLEMEQFYKSLLNGSSGKKN